MPSFTLAIMAPKKRTSTANVKNALVKLKTVKEGQIVSVQGKIMSKTGVMICGCPMFCFMRCDYI